MTVVIEVTREIATKPLVILPSSAAWRVDAVFVVDTAVMEGTTV